MASPSTQSNLVVQRIQDMADLANSASADAKRYLEDLATGVNWNSANLVDVNIGTNANVAWNITVSQPSQPVEPDYGGDAQPLTDAIHAQLQTVLGGALGVVQSIWDSIWAEATSSIARDQVGRLRTARNRGAPSYWSLPSETVLAEVDRINDEAAEASQRARFEQVQRQAMLANESFWKAVSGGTSSLETLARATSSMLSARLGASVFELDKQIKAFSTDEAKNRIAVEIAKITQAAQEAAARLDIGQAEWAEGQANSTKSRIAELAFGFAQAAFAASDVSLHSGTNVSESISHSDSMNEPLDHSVTFN